MKIAVTTLLLCLSLNFLRCASNASSTGACGAPPVIEHTTNNSTGDPPYPTDTVIKYECNEGYIRNGYKYVRCLENGTWWQHAYYPLTCRPRSCGDPGTPENGEKDSYLYTVTSVVRYSCNEGYELNGPANRQCLVSGKWSRSTPTCDIVKCTALAAPANGQITLNNNRREYGSRARLSCNEGFRPGLTTTRVCQGDKTWTGADFVCNEIDCGPHPPVPNAVVEAKGDNKWGHSVHVRCFDNATSSTPDLNYNIIHCNDAGMWSPDPPECWGCCDVRRVVGDNSVPFISDRVCVPHNEWVRSELFSCGEGYCLKARVQILCWNGTFASRPVCSRITCTIPHVKNGAVVGADVGTTVDYGALINVTCENGYRVSGANPVRCDRGDVLYPWCREKLLKRAQLLKKCHKKSIRKLLERKDRKDGKVDEYERELLLLDCYMYFSREYEKTTHRSRAGVAVVRGVDTNRRLQREGA